MALVRFLVSNIRRSYCTHQFKIDDPSPSTFPSESESPIKNPRNSIIIDDDPELENFKSSLTPDQQNRLDLYMAEYALFKEHVDSLPASVSVKEWENILNIKCRKERILHFSYLQGSAMKRAKDKVKKEERKSQLESIVEAARAKIKKEKETHIYYGFNGSYIFRTFRSSCFSRMRNSKLAQAMIHGPHIIFDMSFYPIMRPMEASLTSKQLAILCHENRVHPFPHHLIFTGCNRDHPSWKQLNKSHFTGRFESLMHTVTDKHYLELFPKEKLVYLSPDANDDLEEYDVDKVYIVAALVDKMDRIKLTLGQALEEGIQARRLPLDNMKWLSDNALCLNHVLSIMNDAHAYGNVQAAILTNLPRRKVLAKEEKLVQRMKQEENKARMKFMLSLDPEKVDNIDEDGDERELRE